MRYYPMPTCEFGYSREILDICDSVSHVCHEEVQCTPMTTVSFLLKLSFFTVTTLSILFFVWCISMCDTHNTKLHILFLFLMILVGIFDVVQLYWWILYGPSSSQ